MDRVADDLAGRYPATNENVGIDVLPMLGEAIDLARPALDVLFAMVLCLLLISCLNLATLVGARAVGRRREYVVRVALGASRRRLLRQALAEVMPILAAGELLGIAGAHWGVSTLLPWAPPDWPRLDGIGISGPVLAFSAAVIAVTAVVAGVAPAVQAWRVDPGTAGREFGRATTGDRGQGRLRHAFVMVQVSLVLPMLVAAGLLVRSFVSLTAVNPGFQADGVLSLKIAIPRSKYPRDPQVATLSHEIVARVAALPGVASVGMVNRLPLSGAAQTLMFVFDTPQPTAQVAMVDSRSVTPDYFRTMGIPLIDGRGFTSHDTDTRPMPSMHASFPTVAVVDEQIARRLWPGQTAIGRRFRYPAPDAPWIEVVGVVGHVHHDGLEVDPRPQVYFNYLQRPQDRMAIVVRRYLAETFGAWRRRSPTRSGTWTRNNPSTTSNR